VCARGSGTNSERSRDLVERQVAVKPQRQNLALTPRQAHHRSADSQAAYDVIRMIAYFTDQTDWLLTPDRIDRKVHRDPDTPFGAMAQRRE